MHEAICRVFYFTYKYLKEGLRGWQEIKYNDMTAFTLICFLCNNASNTTTTLWIRMNNNSNKLVGLLLLKLKFTTSFPNNNYYHKSVAYWLIINE